MDSTQAIEGFGALAQPTRLAVLRLLVRAGPSGLPSGEIARLVEAPPSTMSTHLSILARAGFVSSRRDSRLVYYSADVAIIADLIGYLVEDCCEGRPEVCVPISAVVERAACCAPANQSRPAKKKKRA